jgi:hypothetical protein
MEIDTIKEFYPNEEPEAVCFYCHQVILFQTAFKAQGHHFCNPQHYLLSLQMLRPVKWTRKTLL